MPDMRVDRYPGPVSYEDTPAHHHLFCGRDADIRNLTYQIIASRLLVLFGLSGLGKTSLVQAGIFPKLRAQEFFPILVRLNCSIRPLELVARRCEEASKAFAIDYVPGRMDSAWEFFKTAMFWRGDTLVSPVMVFDQFEEIFTLAEPAWRNEFAVEFGALASGSPTLAIRERLKGDAGLGDQAPKVKTVLSLREEWYGSLEELSRQIPGLFQDRFQLRPLSTDRAQEAIEGPAGALPEGGTEFSTPGFRYDPAALQMMLGFLKGHFGEIEPFQLQLLCQDVEQRVVKPRSQEAGGAVGRGIVIMPEDLGGERAMEAVLDRFYQRCLGKIAVRQRSRAQELCDTGLLTPSGHRLMLQADQISRDFGVTQDTLQRLVRERILREVPRLESIFYEISHDRLAQSILKARPWRVPRKYRVPAFVAAAFLIAFFSFVGLYNIRLRYERNKATVAQQASEQARGEAEELASYLIGEDLMESVRPIARLNMMEGLEVRVDKYLTSTENQPADNLRQQIEGMSYLLRGDIAYQRYELAKAEQQYLRAQGIFHKLAAESTNKAEAFHNLAEADGKLASIKADQLHLAGALQLFQEALAALDESARAQKTETAFAGSPTNAAKFADKVLRDRADIHQQIGAILTSQGRLADALQHFDQTLQLAPASSESTQWLYVRLDGLRGKADALQGQGHDQAMQEARREALQCAQRAAKLSPFEIRAQYSVANAQHDLTEWETDQNRKLLFPVYVNINRLIDEMVKWDPENKNWRRQYAATLILLADGYAFFKYDQAKAEQVFGDAEHELTELRKIDSTNHSLEMDFEWLYRDRGNALWVAGFNGAGEQYDKALAILDNLRHIDSTNRDVYNAWSYLVIQKVRSLSQIKKYGEAIRLAKEELPVMEAVTPTDQSDALYWSNLGGLHEAMAAALSGSKDFKGAERQYLEAVADARMAIEVAGANAQYWENIADYYGGLSGVLADGKASLSAKGERVKAYEHAYAVNPGAAGKVIDSSSDLGDSLRDNKQLQDAVKAYEVSKQTLIAQIAKADPTSAQGYRNTLFDLLCKKIAPIQAEQGNKDEMLKTYEQAAALEVTAFKAGTQDVEAHQKLASNYQTVADGLMNHGELTAANAYYARASGELAAAEAPAGALMKRQFHLAKDEMSQVSRQRKDPKGEIQAYQEALRAAKGVVSLNPDDAEAHADVAEAYWHIGSALQETGDLGGSQKSFESADQELNEAIRLKPDDAVYYLDRYVLYARSVAPLKEKQGDPAAAFTLYQAGLAAISKAAELDPESASYRYHLGEVHERIGDAEEDQQHPAEALKSYGDADVSLRKAVTLAKESSNDAADYWYEICSVQEKVAELHQRQGDLASAKTAYSEGQKAITTALALKPGDSGYRAKQSEIEVKINSTKAN